MHRPTNKPSLNTENQVSLSYFVRLLKKVGMNEHFQPAEPHHTVFIRCCQSHTLPMHCYHLWSFG